MRRSRVNQILGGNIMRNKWILIIVLLYIISPIDLMPGPIDDAIVALIGYAFRDRNNGIED